MHSTSKVVVQNRNKKEGLGPAESRTRVLAIETYAPRLYQYLRRRLERGEDAQDCLQQVFMRWWQIPQSREVRQPEAYLYRIASNVLSEFGAWSSKQKVVFDSCTAEELAERLPYQDTSSSDLAEQLGITQQLERVLAQIPAIQRVVLLKRIRDGMKVAEIAAELKLTESTVRVYLARGLAACRSADWHR